VIEERLQSLNEPQLLDKDVREDGVVWAVQYARPPPVEWPKIPESWEFRGNAKALAKLERVLTRSRKNQYRLECMLRCERMESDFYERNDRLRPLFEKHFDELGIPLQYRVNRYDAPLFAFDTISRAKWRP
jgi:hypothetical protein